MATRKPKPKPRPVDKDGPGGGTDTSAPTPAYLRVQANRLLACADKLVTNYLSGLDKLPPLTALDTLEKMVRTVASLEDQALKMEGKQQGGRLNVTVNGIEVAELKFSPATNGNGKPSS